MNKKRKQNFFLKFWLFRPNFDIFWPYTRYMANFRAFGEKPSFFAFCSKFRACGSHMCIIWIPKTYEMHSTSLRLSASIYFYRSPMSFLLRNRRRSEALSGFFGQNWCLTGFLGRFKECGFFRSDGQKMAKKSSFCPKYLNFVLPPPPRYTHGLFRSRRVWSENSFRRTFQGGNFCC